MGLEAEALLSGGINADDDVESTSGASLLFHDVSLCVPSPSSESRTILAGVSGLVEPGQCCAVLGASGSGKTSLLDVLSGQTVSTGGVVCLDGVPSSAAVLQESTGYVLQDDRLLPHLTVRETLVYAAHIRLGGRLGWSARVRRADETLSHLGLSNVRNSKIGGTFRRGISGGEKRRVSIGLQLLADPAVLILDEPTTGLDSFTANSIVAMLHRLAERGKTILFTVHQPRSDIFQLLDVVMLLSRGRTVYFGPASGLLTHFGVLGYPCDRYANPLDYFVDVTSVDSRAPRLEHASAERVDRLVAAYEASESRADLYRRIDAAMAAPGVPVRRASKSRVQPFLAAYMLFVRMTTNLVRDPAALSSRMAQFALFSLMFIAFIIKFGNDQQSVQNRTGFLYQLLSGAIFMGMMHCMACFPEHRDLYMRERRDKSYSSLTLLAGYLLHALPAALFVVTWACLMLYLQLGLKPGYLHFSIFWTVVMAL